MSVPATSSIGSGLRNSRAVRWYVLTTPPIHKGIPRGLIVEQSRRHKAGEPELEYFAPTLVEMSLNRGKWIRVEHPLFFNYVFVHSSENEIYRMMRDTLSLYSFLPRIRKIDGQDHYPYLSDDSMHTLRWLSSAYSDILPACSPEASLLVGGDRVRIKEGQFSGLEATVLKSRGRSDGGVVVSIGDWLHVPLLAISCGQYELISLNTSGELKYSRLDNLRLFVSLRDALCRHHRGLATDEDKSLAENVLGQFGSLQVDSGVLRCRLCALLLPCHVILGDAPGFDRLHVLCRELLGCVKADQSRALLTVTLYGCTDNYIYHNQAHELVAPWLAEPKPKRIKAFLIETLSAYDAALSHRK